MTDRTRTLVERRPRELRLTRAERAELAARLGPRLEVAPTARRGVWRVTARGVAGDVRVPGLRLVVRPKIPRANVAVMFDDAEADVPERRDALSLFDRLAGRLAAWMAQRAAAGLAADYVERAVESATPAGRLDRAALGRDADPSPVRFRLQQSHLTIDQPSHRVALAVARLCLGHPGLSATVRADMAAAVAAYHGVGEAADPRGALAGLLGRTLPADEREGLGVCGHLLAGGLGSASFWCDLEAAFEGWVTRAALRECPGARAQVTLALESEGGGDAPRLRPDLLVPRADGRLAVVDTKWKDAGRPEPADVHQVLAYAHAFGAASAHLVYPGARSGAIRFRVPGVGTPLVLHTVRLRGPADGCQASLGRALRDVRAEAGGG